MKKKTRWPVIAGVAFIVVFVAAMFYSTAGNSQYRAEVCVTFEGRTICSKSAASKMEDAERTATSTSCAQLTSGMTNTLACEQSAPRQVTWSK